MGDRHPSRTTQSPHRKPPGLWCALILMAIGVSGCGAPQFFPQAQNNPERSPCVTDYDPQIDYFPEKIAPDFAQGFRVEYGKNYKLVTLPQPWETAPSPQQYLLVQCGTPPPVNYQTQYPQAQLVTIPLENFGSFSTTYLPHFQTLGVLDRLIAIDNATYTSNPQVQNQVAAGQTQEVANPVLNGELLLVLSPAAIFIYRLTGSDGDLYQQLQNRHQTPILEASHLEASPLGRSEWVKYFALFFNQEQAANHQFQAIAQEYEQLRRLTAAIPPEDKPTIISGFNYQGTWHLPGGQSFAAQLFQDAGGNYPWQDTDSRFSIPLDFESVYDQGRNADIWLHGDQNWQSDEDLAAADERYLNFQAAQTGSIYNNNARLNGEGGNDYWETGAANPQMILADLIKIFHPTLLPDHQLYFYQRLSPETP